MNRHMRACHRANSGFTPVERVIIIGIPGAPAAIALANVSGPVTQATTGC